MHLETFPEADPNFAGDEAITAIEQLTRLRDLGQIAVDAAVKNDEFKKREHAAVEFLLPENDPARAILEGNPDEALEFLLVSKFTISPADEAGANVAATDESECPRCRRSIAVNEENGLCSRCDEVVSGLESSAT